MIDCSSGDAFGVFVLPFLECCSAVWSSAADCGACFLAGGMLNCNLSHPRSVAVLCMLYKIRCNPKHPFCGALPVPYVPVRVTRGAFDRTSVYLCSSPLQNLEVPQDFY